MSSTDTILVIDDNVAVLEALRSCFGKKAGAL